MSNEASAGAEAGANADAGTERPPRVFISYAHAGGAQESAGHDESVRELYWFLRMRGIDATCDLPASQRRQDWTLWMEREIRAADFILVIASPAYRRRADGDAAADDGRGVQWEAGLVREVIYRDQRAGLLRVLPVVLPDATADDIPLFLRPYSTTHYQVDEISDAGLETLLRVLLGRPLEIEPALGNPPLLPARPGPGALQAVAVDDRPEPAAAARTASGSAGVDISLSRDDRDALLTALAESFTTDMAAERMLSRIGYPRSRRPGFANAVPEQIWNMILIDLENGAVATPFRALLTSALRDQPHNRVFRLLAQRYGVDPTAG
ncbi:effector-associated domain EAD1-containing protein [Frankia sp. Cas4]|uniref:effector-associated domain EAD1-containing protein n=1 Tax=Frankia sp. Cas4 TaxID=3073927 RepID=UPI002AD30260|nr:effector-associated domain EAD1-containing protein [Frankia sp. Cas4]